MARSIPGNRHRLILAVMLLYGMLFFLPPSANAESDKRWRSIATMGVPRFGHTATTLPNGKVLVVGGNDDADRLGGSELFDPLSGRWSSVAGMAHPRHHHTATMLTDGRVLIAGGMACATGEDVCSNPQATSSAEIYDPVGNTWTPAAPMPRARTQHAAARLVNGKLLLVGGYTTDNSTAADLYDAATNTWSNAGDTGSARIAPSATLLADGRVMIAGGYDMTNACLRTVRIFDPASIAWSTTGELTTPRCHHTATLIDHNDEVIIAGGESSPYLDATALRSIEAYDPATGTWSAVGDMLVPRRGHVAVFSAGNHIDLQFIGGSANGSALASTEYFYRNFGQHSYSGLPMQFARAFPSVSVLASGRILIAGGLAGTHRLAQAEISDLGNLNRGNWLNLPSPRHSHRATVRADGKVLATGGYAPGAGHLAATALFDTTGGWQTAPALNTPRSSHTADLLPDGRVLVAGGANDNGSTASVETLAPGGDAWIAVPSLATPRNAHTSTLLANGQLLVVGGMHTLQYLASSERFDPGGNRWIPAGSLHAGRAFHTATLLPGGKVLVAGGYASTAPLGSAEIYDPVSDTWTPTGPMTSPRAYHTATLLPNGTVLVAGGYDGSDYPASAEIFDPALGVWTRTPTNPAYGRANASATLLGPDGLVLLAGGSNMDGFPTDYEMFDPATGRWSIMLAPGTDESFTAGELHSATRLGDGVILLAGGYGSAGTRALTMKVLRTVFTDSPPVITSAPATLTAGAGRVLDISGSQLMGYPTSANIPMVRLNRLDDGLEVVAAPATVGPTGYRSRPLPPLPAGTYHLSAAIEGLSSASSLVKVLPPAISLSPASLPSATFGVHYNQTISAFGGSAPHDIALIAGELPPGLFLASAGTQTTLAGSPTTAGSFTFAVEARDSSSGVGPFHATKTYTVSVQATIPGAPTGLRIIPVPGAVRLLFGTPEPSGGSADLTYTARCVGGGTTRSATGSESPLVVAGLTEGVVYTCTVRAANSAGQGPSTPPVSKLLRPVSIMPILQLLL